MSAKHKARVAAKEAVGDVARVDKIKGQLVVKRTSKTGRLRDWHSRTKNLLKNTLPNWQVISEGNGTIVMEVIK